MKRLLLDKYGTYFLIETSNPDIGVALWSNNENHTIKEDVVYITSIKDKKVVSTYEELSALYKLYPVLFEWMLE